MSRDFRRIAGQAVLPLAAAGMFVFAVVAVIQPARTRADAPASPPIAPVAAALAGTGIVEPESELISVAAELPGVVRQVLVVPGDRVDQGQALFALDSRAARAALDAARAEVVVAGAAVTQAEVALADARQRLVLFESVDDVRAVSADELQRSRFSVRRAEAGVAAARAALGSARAAVAVRQTDLNRLMIAAPIAGRVYRVNVRPGEFAPAGASAQPLITLGADGQLHVRAEFDEADAPRLRSNARAWGIPRGEAAKRISLTYVRTEPQVVEKRTLSGGSERVDTRVVQVLYSFDPAAHPIWLGQRMDVFVEAPTRATAGVRP